MADRALGWDYPPGVTGNEPQIAGGSEDDCIVCGEPWRAWRDMDCGPYARTPSGEGVLCSPRCAAIYTLENSDDDTVALLDAALELDTDATVVRVHRAAVPPVEGRVMGRTGPSQQPLSYTLEDDAGAERDVLVAMIERVEVVTDG